MKPNARLLAQHFRLSHKTETSSGENMEMEIEFAIGYQRISGVLQPVELSFVTRGKIGQGIDLLLQDIGIAVSRALQGRDHETGRELVGENDIN